jgi:DNA/RNA-binding domain of Phe-tRNA-synthetase-like protein
MRFEHSADIWRDYPALVPGVVAARGLEPAADVSGQVAGYVAMAGARLAGRSESDMPEIRAWRRAFSSMGLRPTQYRCAAEALLRRYRKERALPEIHPLIDLCNAVSLAFAIPVAVFDAARIQDYLEVRRAAGDEIYVSFAGSVEQPAPGEVIFADSARHVHARRWTHRQSALSVVQDSTSSVLIVAEALHDSAATDVPDLVATLVGELQAAWSAPVATAILSRSARTFAWQP